MPRGQRRPGGEARDRAIPPRGFPDHDHDEEMVEVAALEDALRAVAIVWMAAFHFCFDLNLYGLIEPKQNFYRDPFWTVQRVVGFWG